MKKAILCVYCVLVLSLGACSRQQSDWEKTRAANTTEAYEQFVKKYPNGEFSKQAEAHLKELYEERDWQKARDTDTQEAYQAYLKQYPEGKWAVEARNRRPRRRGDHRGTVVCIDSVCRQAFHGVHMVVHRQADLL